MNKYLRMFLVMGISFLISGFFLKNIFLASSPKINPNAGRQMLAKVNNFWSKSTIMFARNNITKQNLAKNNIYTKPSNNFSITSIPTSAQINNNTTTNSVTNSATSNAIKEALTATLSKVSQGVYAGEKNNIQVYEIRTNEIEYLEYTFTVKGKEIKIKVPKDQTKPTQAEMETLFK